MGLLDLLIEQDKIYAKSPAPPPVPNTSTSSSSSNNNTSAISTNLFSSEGTNIPPTPSNQTDKDDKEDEWINANGTSVRPENQPATVWDTRIVPVPTSDLIWAPYYRIKGRLFPARLCKNEEALTESWLKVWPLPDDEVVVEILCQPKTSVTSRFLVVKSNQIVPFWAYNKQDQKTNYDQLVWNDRRFAVMQKVMIYRL
jgi:hypothetical protein